MEPRLYSQQTVTIQTELPTPIKSTVRKWVTIWENEAVLPKELLDLDWFAVSRWR
jgi:hypothetical protein